MDNAIVKSVRKDIGDHLLRIMKENRISRRRISKLTGINRDTVSYIISGKSNYLISTYIIIMGALNEIIGQKYYSKLNLPYRAVNKYCSIRKCKVIEGVVAEYIGITIDYMKAHSRNREQVKARMYCYKLELKFTKISKSDVANRFGLDHATILNAIKRLDNLIETKDPWVSDWKNLDDYFEEKWKKDNINIKDLNITVKHE